MPAGLPLPDADIRTVAAYLAPTYIRAVPLADGWNSWFCYAVDGTPALNYAIRSMGRDGIPDSSPVWGQTTSFDADVILVDGQFVQYPAGVQQ